MQMYSSRTNIQFIKEMKGELTLNIDVNYVPLVLPTCVLLKYYYNTEKSHNYMTVYFLDTLCFRIYFKWLINVTVKYSK